MIKTIKQIEIGVITDNLISLSSKALECKLSFKMDNKNNNEKEIKLLDDIIDYCSIKLQEFKNIGV